MKLRLLMVFSLCTLVLTSGCAFKTYIGPSSGRSAEYQLTMAKAADAAFDKVKLDILKDKKVFVEVNGLTEKAAEISAEEGYTRALVFQKLFEAGAEPVDKLIDADARISVRQRIAGIDIVERHLPGIYYRVGIRGVCNARLVLFDCGTKKILDTIDVHAVAYYSEVYWFYFFRPSRSMEVLEDADPIYSALWVKKEGLEKKE